MIARILLRALEAFVPLKKVLKGLMQQRSILQQFHNISVNNKKYRTIQIS